jgi:transcriptional regulator with XRE-family HTH domain
MKKKSEAKNKKKTQDMKHPNRMMAFRQGIQKRAREMGHRISVDQFAAAAGITTSYWRMLERNQYDPRENLKERIAWVLNQKFEMVFPSVRGSSSSSEKTGIDKKIESPFNMYSEKSKTRTETKSIFEIIEDLVKKVPDEVWDEFPKDGASNLDHYLYGSPKKHR